MKQRDALMDGAKKCLVEKGFAGTTARDIAAASGAHLGSIGYHFGSKDRLMSLAAMELSSEWGDTVEGLARSAGGDTPGERLVALLGAILSNLPQSRDVQAVSLQAFVHGQFDEVLREQIAEGAEHGRNELRTLLAGVEENADSPPDDAAELISDDAAAGLGALGYALVTGLMMQFLIDRDSLPDAGQFSAALRLVGRTAEEA